MAKASPHETWPKVLKWFLIMRYATRHLFPSWRTNQRSWELLLTTSYEGGRYANGRIIKMGVDPGDVYELAVADAEKWKTEGSKAAFL